MAQTGTIEETKQVKIISDNPKSKGNMHEFSLIWRNDGIGGETDESSVQNSE